MKNQNKNIAVILSGCGFYDGSEIYETTLTFLAIKQLGYDYQCFAPNIMQKQVIDYTKNQPAPGEKRNVLIESARLARGKIADLDLAQPDNFIGAIFPGGSGAVQNLLTSEAVAKFIPAMIKQKKPMGFICIAPMLIPKFYPAGVKLTIGNDPETASKIEQQGGKHINCSPQECVVDEDNLIVTTPAFMPGKHLAEIQPGIEKLVKNLVKLAQK